MVKLTKTYRRLVRDTTINDTTLLSTDYLNHFNELAMMVELSADMPDMLDDVGEWHFKSYQEHFADSVFQHKDLAVWAYEHAPDLYRAAFDRCANALHGYIDASLPTLMDFHAKGDDMKVSELAQPFAKEVAERIDAMSAIINGAVDGEDATELADQAESGKKPIGKDGDSAKSDDGTKETMLGQSDIDALFD